MYMYMYVCMYTCNIAWLSNIGTSLRSAVQLYMCVHVQYAFTYIVHVHAMCIYNVHVLSFQALMMNDDSPIKDYYPVEFQTDLNGKAQEWEAVVLIPFIDEERLLAAMSEKNGQLTKEVRERGREGGRGGGWVGGWGWVCVCGCGVCVCVGGCVWVCVCVWVCGCVGVCVHDLISAHQGGKEV